MFGVNKQKELFESYLLVGTKLPGEYSLLKVS